MANILGFLKSVSLQLKGNWPNLRGTAVPPGLALQTVLAQGASQAPVLVRGQTLQREGIQKEAEVLHPQTTLPIRHWHSISRSNVESLLAEFFQSEQKEYLFFFSRHLFT